MSLFMQSGAINIQNASNQTKFTSNNRLVFQKAFQTGSVYVGPNGAIVPFLQDGGSAVVPAPNDFLILTIKITSSSGLSLLTNSFLNKEMPGNKAIIVDIDARALNQAAAVDQETFSGSLCGSDLHFRTIRMNYNGIYTTPTTGITLTYKARLISYI